MARIKMTAGEFGDYVSALIYDKMTNPEEIIPPEINVDFNDLMGIAERKGMRTIFLAYWLKMNPQNRVKYRMTRGVFNPDKRSTSVILEITWEAPKMEKKEGMIGRLMKKFIKGEFDEKEKK